MLTAIEGVIAELRQIGVPVSLAERIDAVRSLEYLPLADRDGLRAALRAVLVKSHDHETVFDTVFDIYFSPQDGELAPLKGAAGSDSGANRTAPEGQSAGEQGGEGASGGSGLSSMNDAGLIELLVAALRDDSDLLLRAIAAILVDRHAGIEPGRAVAGTYYVFRTLRAVDPERLLTRLAEGGGSAPDQPATGPPGLARRLQIEENEVRVNRFRQAVEAQVRQRLIKDRGAAAVARTLRRPLPEDTDFLTSSREQIVAMRAALDPLTRRLAGRLSQKRRLRQRGTLDFRRTMRKSLSTGGVPVKPAFRKPTPHRPELFVLADISGSVATFAAFTLQLMFALRSQFSKVRSFVFVDGMDEVTDVLQRAPDILEATRHINEAGSGVWLDGRSDYGHALDAFWAQWGEQVRRRTTVIVLGDARTNYHDPRDGVLKAVRRQAAHLFWLNPEPMSAWDSGDSVISRYAPHCDAVYECRTIRQLRRFVEDLD